MQPLIVGLLVMLICLMVLCTSIILFALNTLKKAFSIHVGTDEAFREYETEAAELQKKIETLLGKMKYYSEQRRRRFLENGGVDGRRRDQNN